MVYLCQTQCRQKIVLFPLLCFCTSQSWLLDSAVNDLVAGNGRGHNCSCCHDNADNQVTYLYSHVIYTYSFFLRPHTVSPLGFHTYKRPS